MRTSERALGLLRCPACARGGLAIRGGAKVVCDACAAAFACKDGVIDLLPDHTARPTLAQRAMQSEAIVRIYESRLWRRSLVAALFMGISFESERDLIFRAADLTGGERILDLACGPGIYARALARSAPRGAVVGLDLSLPMLSYASHRREAEGLTNLALVRGNAMSLPLPSSQLDLVNCCGALHLFPDVPRVLGEVQRVLKPGGAFTVAAFRRRENQLAVTVTALRRRWTGVDAFSRRELEGKLRAAGFSAVRCHHARAGWLVMSARK